MNKPLRTLLIDDERLSRMELRNLLKPHQEIDVVGEADSMTSAIDAVRAHRPDLIFLDIEMPGGSGFDLLERIGTQQRVIFVTAYDQHAIRAFEVNALDYLLKPVNPSRLARALQRLSHESVIDSSKLLTIGDRILLSEGERAWFVRVSDIVCIIGADDYSQIFTADGRRCLSSKTLKHWETRLPTAHFIRVHRSAIVNLEHVQTLEADGGGGFTARLRNTSQSVAVSRRHAVRLKQLFE